jgi:hypothetical protein
MLASDTRGEDEARFAGSRGAEIKKAASRVAGGLTSGSRDRVLDRSLLSQPQTAARVRIKAPAFLTGHVGYETNHEPIMEMRAARRKRDRAHCSVRGAWRKMTR